MVGRPTFRGDLVSPFPYLRTDRVILEPAPFRSGVDLHDRLRSEHRDCVPDAELFVDLYCPEAVDSIALQLEVTATAGDERPVGYATLMDLDPHAQHVRAGVYVDPCAGQEVARDARLLTMNVAFATWNVRKVYTWEIHDHWTWSPPAATLEGTLRQFLHQGSHHLDMDVVATSRQSWDRWGASRVEDLIGG